MHDNNYYVNISFHLVKFYGIKRKHTFRHNLAHHRSPTFPSACSFSMQSCELTISFNLQVIYVDENEPDVCARSIARAARDINHGQVQEREKHNLKRTHSNS